MAFMILYAVVNYKNKQQEYLTEKEEKRKMKEDFEKILMKSQIEVRETTLAKLSKELHDNIGQILSSAKMLLAVENGSFNMTPQLLLEKEEALKLAEQYLGEAINELRLLTKSMDEDWLEQFDLISNLENEIKRINKGKSILILFEHPEKLPLSPKRQIILFRIIQESLQNAIKHSNCKNIRVSIEFISAVINLLIKDDGSGSDRQVFVEGQGIRNMTYRAKQLGGEIAWDNSKGGCCVLIKIPFNENSHEN
ncbi:sensor histidine kinase [Mucilaginibacter aquaedulcis]|uniref:sensor histidine kinase n=1 Tax=Mucilaginibacter aquaedulcis TaxID=1187081 RepID=UPI0025B357C5|nr:ATP-binding protein [Mucilaginibacter aquaedulcis]MDN3548944.1 histidine kinase [Mucilaginibacter aquaedulcis]